MPRRPFGQKVSDIWFIAPLESAPAFDKWGPNFAEPTIEMRVLLKIVMKLVMMVIMVVVMGGVMRHGLSYLMQVSGAPGGPQFSSDESDLMSTVFKSALRLFSGSANRKELSSELSDKLYSGRDKGTMSELGIELVKPGDGSPAPTGGASVANAQPRTRLPAKQRAQAGASLTERFSNNVRTDLLAQFWERAKVYHVELSLVPVVFLGMVLVHRIRRGRRPRPDEFLPPIAAIQTPGESEPFEMKHEVHSLGAEEFELLVALIYQRKGYRVSMPAGLSGGRGGDFTLTRKSERLLVQCKKFGPEHKISMERVRELHEAVTAAGATRGMYVASCGFTWDARNFGKAKGVTLINARTLDELLTGAREKNEDLLDVSRWVPKLMSKVQLTPSVLPGMRSDDGRAQHE